MIYFGNPTTLIHKLRAVKSMLTVLNDNMLIRLGRKK